MNNWSLDINSHIRCKAGDDGSLIFMCNNCSESYPMNLPCPIDFPAEMMKIWIRLHKRL